MSEKQRQKKDGETKDKQNKRMREAESDPELKAIRSQQTGDRASMAETGAENDQTSAATG